MIIDELFEGPQQCPECGGISFSDLILAELTRLATTQPTDSEMTTRQAILTGAFGSSLPERSLKNPSPLLDRAARQAGSIPG